MRLSLTVLSVTTPDFVHVRKNQQALIEFKVTSSDDVSDVSVIAIYPNNTNVTLDDSDGSKQISNNATKEMEGSYRFVVSGTYAKNETTGDGQIVCAAAETTLYGEYKFPMNGGSAFNSQARFFEIWRVWGENQYGQDLALV